jgi:hypothetical protein
MTPYARLGDAPVMAIAILVLFLARRRGRATFRKA